jgi:hypothetical protein
MWDVRRGLFSVRNATRLRRVYFPCTPAILKEAFAALVSDEHACQSNIFKQ